MVPGSVSDSELVGVPVRRENREGVKYVTPECWPQQLQEAVGAADLGREVRNRVWT